MNNGFKEITCDTAEDFLKEITPWTSSLNIKDYVFRGLSDEKYKLIPTAFRRDGITLFDYRRRSFHLDQIGEKNFEFYKYMFSCGKMLKHHQMMAEFDVLREFYRTANSHGLYIPKSKVISHNLEKEIGVSGQALLRLYKNDKWMSKEIVEIAAIAQHYGLPTRLLDWSYSSYIAAFFASSKVKANRSYSNDDYICVWMLNMVKLSDILEKNTSSVKVYNPHYQWNDNALSQRGLFVYVEDDFSLESRSITNKAIRKFWEDPTLIHDDEFNDLFVDIDNGIDQYILRELESFNKSKNENSKISNETNELIVKLKVPSKQALKINRHLRNLNFNEATIFPGYQGVVDNMKYEAQRAKILPLKPRTLLIR